jgi:hypothetical protein
MARRIFQDQEVIVSVLVPARFMLYCPRWDFLEDAKHSTTPMSFSPHSLAVRSRADRGAATSITLLKQWKKRKGNLK